MRAAPSRYDSQSGASSRLARQTACGTPAFARPFTEPCRVDDSEFAVPPVGRRCTSAPATRGQTTRPSSQRVDRRMRCDRQLHPGITRAPGVSASKPTPTTHHLLLLSLPSLILTIHQCSNSRIAKPQKKKVLQNHGHFMSRQAHGNVCCWWW